MPDKHGQIVRHVVLDMGDNLSHQITMQKETITWAVVDREAEALGVTASARLKWRQANRGVPPVWRIRIVENLSQRGLPASLSDFDALPANPGRIAA